MVNVLIALVAVSFIFESWLLSKINKLNKENKIHRKSLQMALEALARDNHNFQAGISRDLEHTNKVIDSNFTRLRKVDKKVDVSKRDIMIEYFIEKGERYEDCSILQKVKEKILKYEVNKLIK